MGNLYEPIKSEDDKPYTLWLSDREKRKGDKELAKDLMDYIDMTHTLDDDKVRKMQENFELHGGRWKEIEKLTPRISMAIGNENITLGSGTLNHFPIIDRVSKSVLADLIMSPLITVIKDNSSKARSHRDIVRLERVKAHFMNNVIQPEIQRVTQEFDAASGVDPAQLPPEAQAQRSSEIDAKVKQDLPDEIMTYLDRLTTPDELVAQALLKEGMRYVKARQKFNIGAENAVVTAEEYYRIGIVNGLPHMEALNPKYVVWAGSENVESCQDGQFAKYVQYLTPEDAISKYSTQLMKEDVKSLSTLYAPIPYFYKKDKASMDGIERRIVDVFADNPELQDKVNIRTRDGQDMLRGLYANLTHSSKEGYGIKETYVTWRWMRRVKFVERVVNGELETFVRDEHYQKDPLAGDVRITERAMPQIWHGTKLGDDIYINVGPVEFQYNNVSDPFNVNLTIFGGKYNTYQNNVDNASFIDLGKPFQYKYNVLMKKMEEHQITDIGNILPGTTSMIPTGWTWSQWFKSLFVAKVAIINNHKEGLNNLDSSVIRSIDLSRANDIANDIRQLEYFENKIVSSMYYSPQKIGQISQYATNENTQASLQGVDRQMYRFFNKNREIKEEVLNAFMHICMYAYKDNEDVKGAVLDDFLRAHYELNFFNTDQFSKFNLSVVNDFAQTEKLNQMRNLALTMLQNGLTASQLSALFDTDSMGELKQLLEDIDKKIEKQAQEKHQQDMQLLDQQRANAEAQIKLQQAFVSAEAERDRAVKIRMAEINSLMLQNANDVDRDGINDAMQRTLIQIESDERIARMKVDAQRDISNKKVVKK